MGGSNAVRWIHFYLETPRQHKCQSPKQAPNGSERRGRNPPETVSGRLEEFLGTTVQFTICPQGNVGQKWTQAEEGRQQRGGQLGETEVGAQRGITNSSWEATPQELEKGRGKKNEDTPQNSEILL